ncbi:MAG TPA: hypothetical protein VHV30_10395 [Polyangiaceae bacterium]|nr:hypothetical protein [Polyangiaceae bacterium]
MTDARFLAWLLVAAASCKFGGPSGNPEAYVTEPSDASTDATADADATTPPSDDGPAADDTSDAQDTGPGDAADAGVDDALEARPANDACGKAVAVCDPIHNTGCNPLQQCDVDTSQATTPTGICVFNGGAADGAPCSSSVVNESCPPKSTCSAAQCRELCACDADCPAGQCCSDPTGPPGFLFCAPCP